MKIRVLIVDDESLARDRLRQLLEQEPEIEVVGECSDGRAAVEEIRKRMPDLIFLDVQMPELDGFGVLQKIGPQAAPVIVFVTAFDQFALRAFDVHAIDYLLKPFDRDRFRQALGRAIEQVKNREAHLLVQRQQALIDELKPPVKSNERIAVKSGGHAVWVNLEEIDWIGSADNYAELHVGAKSHLLRETLGALEARLPPEKFVRVSRSVIINISRVQKLDRKFYGGYELTLQDGTTLTMSRRYRDKLRQLGLR
ncbi:MAG TPA: LytTR family DNA-binding domain-containing protein [Verrucomicrobiae bacterium]|jgi:two-component system LytT family response regulator|nr:LytTR family DNA-binding domain-containing protein [Verrucomicrobiae bacterium]